MKKRFFGILGLIGILILFTGCNHASSQNQSTNTSIGVTATNTSSTLSDTRSVVTANEICSQLKYLKRLPNHYDNVSDDPVYNQFLSNRDQVIPCLIDKITDTTLMEDPSPGPTVDNYRVGDAAMFVLLLITKEKWQPETMFPPKYAELWKTEGVYAYYGYVEQPANRQKLQLWWKGWMKNNQNLKND